MLLLSPSYRTVKRAENQNGEDSNRASRMLKGLGLLGIAGSSRTGKPAPIGSHIFALFLRCSNARNLLVLR
jgi:hypothetical protein